MVGQITKAGGTNARTGGTNVVGHYQKIYS